MAKELKTETLTFNMGPQHPATHGVLRLVLTVDGETVVKARPVVGYLHRGMEKIAENKTYNQFVVWTDKLDYLHALSNNIAYIMAVEKMMDIEVPAKGKYLRVLCCELNRIASHMVWLGTNALDVGAATVFFYTFQNREDYYDTMEILTGGRMNVAFTRVGGHSIREIPTGFEKSLRKAMKNTRKYIDSCEGLLNRNRIWLDRNRGIGAISAEKAIDLGLTGPPLRACGVPFDIRKDIPYLGYEKFDFDIPVGEKGDCYDRYLVRMEEMKQSLMIMEQVLEGMPEGPINIDNPKVFLPRKQDVYTKMEEMIDHFMILTDGIKPKGESYFSVENSKGELGFYVMGDGDIRPYRLHIKSPSFVNLQAMAAMMEGSMISDVIAIIASMDPVLGEVDR